MSGATTATYIAGAGLALSAASTATGMIGQANQAQAQAGQANYMAQVARNNSIIAQRNATLATQQGDVAADQSNLKTAQIEGAQRASLASQGGDVNSGSPLDIVSDTARAGYTDAATIRSNAALQAYGYKLQAAGADASGVMYDRTAANATANLPFALGSSLLGGASSIARSRAG